MDKPIEERSVEETLDAVESLWLGLLEGNSEIFQLAAHYADLCNGDGLTHSAKVLPGTERSVQLGGEGTPRVSEFAATELGARIRMGTVGARHLMADALDVRHRLPLLWVRVQAREVRVPWARHVAAKTRHLSKEAAAKVDSDMVECADGRLPWSRFCYRLEGRIVAADPEAAARREEERRREVYAKATRFSDAGMKAFVLRGPAAWVIRFDATVAYVAEALKAMGDTDDEDQRRVKACLILANPTQAVEVLAAYAAHRARDGDADEADLFDDQAEGADESDAEAGQPPTPLPFHPADLPAWLARACDPDTSQLMDFPRLLPQVNLYLHLAEETVQAARDGAADGVVRWDGEGPVTWSYVRQELAPYHHFRVVPVVDLAGQEPVDAYEIPRRHREAVRLRTPADCFPFTANLGADLDIDHNEAYERAPDGSPLRPGQSRLDNYGPMGRFSHRLKTHGGWRVKQPFDGIYVWRDPHGHYYLVDHTGTRKVSPPRRRRASPAAHPRPVVEIYKSDVGIDVGDLTPHRPAA